MVEYGIELYAADAAPGLSALVESAESERYAFAQRTYDEWMTGLNRFGRDGEGFWIATTVGGGLVGMCGLDIDPYDAARLLLGDFDVGPVDEPPSNPRPFSRAATIRKGSEALDLLASAY